MKILMLSWEYPPRIVGGISRVVYDLTQQLAKQDHEIHVITCWDFDAKEFEQEDNIYVYRVKSYEIHNPKFTDWVMHMNFVMVEYGIKLMNQIKDIDIIHAHDWLVAYTARVLKHAYKIPLICTIHATEHGRNNGIYNDMQRYIHNVEWWLAYESWKVICNSDYMENEIKHIFGVPENKVQVIPNGICVDYLKGVEKDMDFRRKFALDNEKIIFFVGRLVQEKGVHILLEAATKVMQYYHDIKIVIVGKGNQMEYLNWRSEDLGIKHKVCFTGYMDDDDLKKLYKCIDIAVFPSLYEPFGIVALEAMLANVPAVVSDTGGLGALVNHGVDGMKAYTGNANSLADSILALLHQPDLYDEIRHNAFEKVQKHYNWHVIADKTLEVYQKVIEERKQTHW